MNLAEHMRTIRKARQLTQEEAAHQAGVSLRAYQGLERGEALDPHFSTLSRISKMLGVPVQTLMEEEPDLAGKAPAR